MAAHSIDSTLDDWEDVPDERWDTLLVGNGLSINVSSDFDYESLYEEADKSTVPGSLTDVDRAIFERLDTTNFELVLGKLRDAIQLAEVLGENPEPYLRRFRSVQTALGTAVRGVHLELVEFPDATRDAIKEELGNYRAIFTTSYDLVIYWSIGYDEEYGQFCDCFWANGRNEFDPDDCEVWPGRRPVYYLHGALHLIVEGSGITRKLIRERPLLEQFGEPVPGDPQARPLLISEGSPRDKLSAIERNEYLAHVYETLQDRDGPLLGFGHALGEQDRHLIDAINANPGRPVAVSMRKKGKKRIREQKADILGKLETEDVFFFDAATHPLGSLDLTTHRTRFPFKEFRSKVGAAVARAF